jgi:RND family efflux transporter MFP subunit
VIAKILRIVAPLAVLGAGAATFVAIKAARPVAVSEPPVVAPTRVRVQPATSASGPVVVTATGTVQAGAQIELVPQVGGRIVEMASGLTPGRRFATGDLIARIDSRDYENAVAQARAAVAQADLEVALEAARADAAKSEWTAAGHEGEPPSLAARGPQRLAVEAKLAAAQSALGLAETNVGRTKLVAPFPCIVAAESLDIGQVVAPGVSVGRLIGTERYRVRAALAVHELDLVKVPGLNASVGSPATITQRLADGRALTLTGVVQRALGELDAETRTAGVLISVDDPYGQTQGDLPVLPGAYVDVALEGSALANALEIPRIALTDGDRVWVAAPDDTLAERRVQVAWGDAERVFVTGGVDEGERIVVSPLSLPSQGQPVSVEATP